MATPDYLEIDTLDPAKLVERVIQAGEDWADAEAAAQSLEDTRKRQLAELTLVYLSCPRPDGKGTLSAIAAETHALADPKYLAHLDMAVEMRREANKLRVRYDLGKMYIELLRSKEATRRAETRM
jgi:hypothetical protein